MNDIRRAGTAQDRETLKAMKRKTSHNKRIKVRIKKKRLSGKDQMEGEGITSSNAGSKEASTRILRPAKTFLKMKMKNKLLHNDSGNPFSSDLIDPQEILKERL